MAVDEIAEIISAGMIVVVGAAVLFTIYFPNSSGAITDLTTVAIKAIISLGLVALIAGAVWEAIPQ